MKSKCQDTFIPLHYASFHGNLPLIQYLVAIGSDPLTLNKCNINMLHCGAQGDQPISIAYFLKLNLDINSRDIRESTALHWAAFSGSEYALQYLCAKGSDVNAQDAKGYTPLHLAVKASEHLLSTRSIRALLLKGADASIRDHTGQLPSDILL